MTPYRHRISRGLRDTAARFERIHGASKNAVSILFGENSSIVIGYKCSLLNETAIFNEVDAFSARSLCFAEVCL